MTEQLTMNRVIHAAVRRDLDRLIDALGQLSDGDLSRARALDGAYRNLRTELTHHHEGEDTHIWPMLATAGVDQHLLEAMEGEHEAMARALADSAAAMATLATTGTASDATAARDSLIHTRGVTEAHLRHEETELEPQLTPFLDTPEWHAVEKKLRSQSLPEAGRFFAWLTDGISAEHRAVLKQAVPSPVVVVLSKTFGRRYYREVAPTWR